ncbi:MBL fold metallo-hydrolase [Rhodanobacter sp. OK091]|uniref:MBL fold metallo-hydrolase n=1 Tax=Rhodanobacter sp. OK091 TaxID=1881037 RepID=UPI001C49F6DB|nr:MBL fold metallo-hydrolase [Rhodanobacter sp. OK091]
MSLGMVAGAAHAASPLRDTQGSGFYRLRLGDDMVTALLDGTHPFKADELFTGIERDKVDAILADNFLSSPVEGSINAFLIDTGSHLILIDTGAGPLYGKDGGYLADNLIAAGYRPEDVDDILITHLHLDHEGGLMRNGIMAFPNATIHIAKADLDFWLNPANAFRVPKLLQPMFAGAKSSLGPYVASGQVKPFEPDQEVVEGIRAIAAPGHTPGHTWFLVSSGKDHLLAWGDTVHVAAVQLAEPQAAIKYDFDSAAAVSARQRAFAEAASKGYWIAAAHISFPGLGHIQRAGQGFTWIPANYTRTP